MIEKVASSDMTDAEFCDAHGGPDESSSNKAYRSKALFGSQEGHPPVLLG